MSGISILCLVVSCFVILGSLLALMIGAWRDMDNE